MPYTSYVLDSDGVMSTVTDWTTVEETLVENYHEGQNYRDEFDTPTNGSYFGNGSTMQGVWFPGTDGQTLDDSLGANNVFKARLSDPIVHMPPRAESVKHTRLRFKDAAGIIIADFKPGEWTKRSNEPFRRI